MVTYELIRPLCKHNLLLEQNVPAGHQQLVLAEGQRDLKLLQQLEELRQVALGETLGLRQRLFHH